MTRVKIKKNMMLDVAEVVGESQTLYDFVPLFGVWSLSQEQFQLKGFKVGRGYDKTCFLKRSL